MIESDKNCEGEKTPFERSENLHLLRLGHLVVVEMSCSMGKWTYIRKEEGDAA